VNFHSINVLTKRRPFVFKNGTFRWPFLAKARKKWPCYTRKKGIFESRCLPCSYYVLRTLGSIHSFSYLRLAKKRVIFYARKPGTWPMLWVDRVGIRSFQNFTVLPQKRCLYICISLFQMMRNYVS